MASFEGSIGVPSGGFNLLVEYSISQSIDGNYSDVSATGYVKRNNSSYYPYNSQSSSSLTIDGSSAGYSGSYNLGSDGYKAIVSHSKRVYHNSDGTKGITISFSFNGLLSNWYPNGSISQYITLPTIPRASGVSCSSPYIGDTATIIIDRKSSNFTHTVSYHIGSLTATIADKTSATVLSLNTESIKSQIYGLMPNSKSIAGTIRCRTYSGNTKIGDTQVANFNLYAKENECKPDVSGVVIDTNEDTIDLTGDSSILIKNASKPKVTVSATPKYSSTISSYSINLNDGQTSNSQEHTFDTINSNSITVSATDSRGYSNSSTIDLTNRVIDYVKLAFNEIDLQRTESTSSEVILNADGAFYNGTFKNSSQLNLRNIRVGDNLSGKTLYFDFPSIVSEEESYTILSTNNNKGINYRGGESSQDVVLNDEETIYLAMYENKHLEESYTQINLSNNFGTVEYIDANSEIYSYIYIQEGESTRNSLNCSFMYKESGTENWTNGGTITPTITNNTFSFNNLSLGNNFDYEKEYQFKIISTDLLMTIGSENKDIHVVTKGIAVVEIGDSLVNINGILTVNDQSIMEQYSTTEVKTNKVWIDGKPIYSKVIVLTIPNQSAPVTADITTHGIINYDKIWLNGDSFLETTSGAYKPLNMYEDSSYHIRTEISREHNYIVVIPTANNYYSGTAYIILEYTKTTD